MNFNEIINANKQNIKNIIKLITKQENEDIEQEVYVRVYQKQELYQEKGKLFGWIGTITKNLSKDYIKSSAKKLQQNSSSEENLVNTIKDNADNPEVALLKKERQKRIVKAINALKPKFKEVIIMYEIDGLSYEYIAKTINCPVGTVKSRLYTAKQQLAEILADLM